MDLNGNLSKNVKITIGMTPATDGDAGTTDIACDELDMSGWDNVLMIVAFGAITGSAVTSIKAQQDTVTGMGSAADLLGTSQTVADSDDNKVFYIDLCRPMERFVRCYIDRATQNAVVSSVLYVQYNGNSVKLPPSHGTGVSGEVHNEPVEGTA